jgi:predicted TIM-barrel fold metal-dependent hydrolase
MIKVGGESVAVVDCDVHESYGSARDLLPYLPDVWKRYYAECGFSEVPRDPYTATAHGGRRADSWPESGGQPGSDYGLLKKQLLDEHGIDYAVLCGHVYRLSAMPQADFATALAAAYNDWVIDTWLPRDARFRGSLNLALQNPKSAAREVDRLGSHPQIVQAILPPVAERPYGSEEYDIVWEAIERNGLVAALHVSPFTGLINPPTPTGGWPRTYMEYHSVFSLAYQAQLTNMICEGVFERHPGLRLVLLEAGWYWVPHVAWTLDAHWKSLQIEVPWLKRAPSQYIRDHVWFGTQPVVLPEKPEHFDLFLEIVGSDRLVFASDYPHWDFDPPERFLPPSVPLETRKGILGRNALELFGLPAPTPQEAPAR